MIERKVLGYLEESERLTVRVGEKAVPARPHLLFPLSQPEGALVLLDDDGNELAHFNALDELSTEERRLVERELSFEHFVPRLLSVERVSSFDFPAIWQVTTDRGATELSLRGVDSIRRLGRFSLLLIDDSGLEVRAPAWNLLDVRTRKTLERFL